MVTTRASRASALSSAGAREPDDAAPRKRRKADVKRKDRSEETALARTHARAACAPAAKLNATTLASVSQREDDDTMRAIEVRLYEAGWQCVCGVDEAGRGPLAGPVVASACFVPLGLQLDGVNDSKLLAEAHREELFEALTMHPDVRYSVSVQPPAVVDDVNILQATMLAMREAIAGLKDQVPALDFAVVDGNRSPYRDVADSDVPLACEAVVKGDQRCFSVAAASIIAKVTRDRLMLALDDEFPVFEFARHKGYPTARHLALLAEHGPCPEHRRSFAPVRLALEARDPGAAE